MRTGNFSISPRYDAKQGAHQRLAGQRRDRRRGPRHAAIGQLAGRITTMTIASVGYGLSREARPEGRRARSRPRPSRAIAPRPAITRSSSAMPATRFARSTVEQRTTRGPLPRPMRDAGDVGERARSEPLAGRARQGDRRRHRQRHGADRNERSREPMTTTMTEPRLRHVQCLGARGLHRMAYWEWGDAGDPARAGLRPRPVAPGPRLRHAGAGDARRATASSAPTSSAAASPTGSPTRGVPGPGVRRRHGHAARAARRRDGALGRHLDGRPDRHGARRRCRTRRSRGSCSTTSGRRSMPTGIARIGELRRHAADAGPAKRKRPTTC